MAYIRSPHLCGRTQSNRSSWWLSFEVSVKTISFCPCCLWLSEHSPVQSCADWFQKSFGNFKAAIWCCWCYLNSCRPFCLGKCKFWPSRWEREISDSYQTKCQHLHLPLQYIQSPSFFADYSRRLRVQAQTDLDETDSYTVYYSAIFRVPLARELLFFCKRCGPGCCFQRGNLTAADWDTGKVDS